MKPSLSTLCTTLPACAVAAAPLASPAARSTPLLGSAQAFAVLGAATVTNTGATTVWGDLGVAPGSALTGLGSLTLSGALHSSDPVAGQARADALSAYAGLQGLQVGTDLSGQDLGGLTLRPGVYRFSAAAQLSGALTLDAQNDPAALFVFQIGSALTTASQSSVAVRGAGAGTGVFWQVGSSATLGAGTLFAGNLLADQAITLDSGARILCGRAIALHAAVTLDGNLLSNDCLGSSLGSGLDDGGSAGFSAAGAGPDAPLPEPGTLLLACAGLAGLGWRGWRSAAAGPVTGL